MKLTSAYSPCPRHLCYDFLLKPYLSYNEFSPSVGRAVPAFAQTHFCLCSGELSNERPADSAALNSMKRPT